LGLKGFVDVDVDNFITNSNSHFVFLCVDLFILF